MRFEATCVLDHHRSHGGLLAGWRNDRWLARHTHPEVPMEGSLYDRWDSPTGLSVVSRRYLRSTIKGAE